MRYLLISCLLLSGSCFLLFFAASLAVCNSLLISWQLKNRCDEIQEEYQDRLENLESQVNVISERVSHMVASTKTEKIYINPNALGGDYHG